MHCTTSTSIALIVAIISIIVFSLSIVPKNYDSSNVSLGSGSMFDSIAGQYDVVNKFLSLGMDMRWRRLLLAELNLVSDDCVLDLATGTGDVAILEGELLRDLTGKSGSKGMVIGIDPSHNMLKLGRDKVALKGLEDIVQLNYGDAQNLTDIPDAYFDKISMSFGIRNVPDRNAALREIRRVSKSDAIIAIMELHAPSNGLLAPLGRAAVRILPHVLGVLTGAPEQYKHLESSIFAFPDPNAWQEQMGDNGLVVFKSVDLFLGCVWLYLAHPIVVNEETERS